MGELRRHPDGSGLVDDQHADEHTDSSEDRLRDHPGTTGRDEVGEQERRRAQEEPLQRGIAQHDRRAVLLATERRDQHHRQSAERADEHERHHQREVLRHQEVRQNTDHSHHGQREAGLGDDVIDGERPGDARLSLVGVLDIWIGLYRLRAVAGGTGTELRVAALPLGQGTKYRVAGLPHRRFLSDALVRLVDEHSLNDWRR